MRDLTLRPGATALAYVRGKRQTFANPLSYFLLAASLSLLLFLQQADAFRESLQEGVQAGFSFLTPAQGARYLDLMLASIEVSYAYQLAFFVAVTALFWRLLFRRAGFTVAELFVPALYAMGHVSLLQLPLSVGEIAGLYTVPTGVSYLLSLLLSPLFFGWTAAGFFPGRPWVNAAKGFLAFFLAFAIYGALRDGALIAYVLLTT